jgi:thymidylate kinase
MKMALKSFRRARLMKGRNEASPSTDGKESGHHRRVTWAVALWALSLALEKKTKLKRVHRARSRGMIVLCDRYPQIQVTGFNDGPLLGDWIESKSRMRRKLARWEYAIYERATKLSPDLVIKLDLTPEVAAERQSETSIEDLHRRRRVVHEMDFGDTCGHVVIDASAPLEDVILNVKRAIWERF